MDRRSTKLIPVSGDRPVEAQARRCESQRKSSSRWPIFPSASPKQRRPGSNFRAPPSGYASTFAAKLCWQGGKVFRPVSVEIVGVSTRVEASALVCALVFPCWSAGSAYVCSAMEIGAETARMPAQIRQPRRGGIVSAMSNGARLFSVAGFDRRRRSLAGTRILIAQIAADLGGKDVVSKLQRN